MIESNSKKPRVHSFGLNEEQIAGIKERLETDSPYLISSTSRFISIYVNEQLSPGQTLTDARKILKKLERDSHELLIDIELLKGFPKWDLRSLRLKDFETFVEDLEILNRSIDGVIVNNEFVSNFNEPHDLRWLARRLGCHLWSLGYRTTHYHSCTLGKLLQLAREMAGSKMKAESVKLYLDEAIREIEKYGDPKNPPVSKY